MTAVLCSLYRIDVFSCDAESPALSMIPGPGSLISAQRCEPGLRDFAAAPAAWREPFNCSYPCSTGAAARARVRPGRARNKLAAERAGIAAQQKRVVDELVRCFGGRGVTSAQSGLPDGDQHCSVPSGDAEYRRRPRVNVSAAPCGILQGKDVDADSRFGRVYQIAKCLDVDRVASFRAKAAPEKAEGCLKR